MRGNEILVKPVPAKGNRAALFVAAGETWYPGMVVQCDPSVALKGGNFTGKIYNRDADGDQPAGPFYVVTNELLADQGKLATDSYAAGGLASCYAPLPGDELNLLVANLSGTGDSHTAGEILMVDDGTGLLIATTGTPETEVAMLLEDLAALTADTLAWCLWSGH